MDNYISQRSKLSARLTEQLARLEKDGYSSETLQAIIETESLLDSFCPQEQSTIEKSLDLTDLRSAVDLLEKAKDLIGGEDEN